MKLEYSIKISDIDRILSKELVEVEKTGKNFVVETDEKRDDIIILNGKPIRVIHDSEWAYKVERSGIRTNKYNAEAFINELQAMCNDAFWNKTYFAMLANAWKVCKAIKEDKPC